MTDVDAFLETLDRPLTEFAFEDSMGLLGWLAQDRAIVRFGDAADAEAKQAAAVDLVNRWVRA